MANTEDKGEGEISADTTGEAIGIRIDGRYLGEALKACGGMVELRLTFKRDSPFGHLSFCVRIS